MNLNDDTIKFAERHGIRVLGDGKRIPRPRRIEPRFFEYSNDFNMIDSVSKHTCYEVEPLLTVEIPQSELDRIANFENQVFNNMAKTGHYNMFEMLMEQKEEEHYLRNKYPAVQKAYEQYSLMLKMAKSGDPRIDK